MILWCPHRGHTPSANRQSISTRNYQPNTVSYCYVISSGANVMSRNFMLCYYTPSFCDMLCTALERTDLFRNFITSRTSVKPFIRTCPPTPSHHQRRISSGSYFLAFTIRVSHTQTPSQFRLRQHNRKQLLLVRLQFCLVYLSMVWTSLVLVKA